MAEVNKEEYGIKKIRPYANIVISAEDARCRAMNAAKTKVEEELQPIFSEIFKASNDVKFQIEYGKKISEQAIKKLNELGYKIKNVDYSNSELGYIISW